MASNRLINKKVLITCGPTWVPIDDMRVISNKSSGQLGQTLAVDLTKAGAKVTLLEGPVDKPFALKNVNVVKFTYFDELSSILKQELKKNLDIVIHAAAVSDYKPSKPLKRKLSSDIKKLNLLLSPTEKIIEKIKQLNKKVLLVGFKLEDSFSKGRLRLKVKRLFDRAHCDFVIANSSKNNKYTGYIVNPDYKVIAKATNRREISRKLINTLKANI